MFGNKKFNIGETIADRVVNYHVWEKLPKKKLKKHPVAYILCPEFRIGLPKVLSKEASEKPHRFTVKIVAETRSELKKMLNHMIHCAQEDIIIGDKRIELCGFHQAAVKIGLHLADLTYIFRIHQLSYGELKKIKMMEENHG